MGDETLGSTEATKLLYKVCDHIKDDGVRCGAPALKGDDCCRFHRRMQDNRRSPLDPAYELPLLETEQSIQIALMQMLRGVLNGKISERKAAIMLSGIKTAAQILRQSKANAPKEALMAEIAEELRGRVATS